MKQPQMKMKKRLIIGRQKAIIRLQGRMKRLTFLRPVIGQFFPKCSVNSFKPIPFPGCLDLEQGNTYAYLILTPIVV